MNFFWPPPSCNDGRLSCGHHAPHIALTITTNSILPPETASILSFRSQQQREGVDDTYSKKPLKPGEIDITVTAGSSSSQNGNSCGIVRDISICLLAGDKIQL